ncbi:MAG: hypothetical protein M1831_001690 [Alyxoria varia]|nr:MAG: hypothetical protein M1831_001690 [Alyxoria varia]
MELAKDVAASSQASEQDSPEVDENVIMEESQDVDEQHQTAEHEVDDGEAGIQEASDGDGQDQVSEPEAEDGEAATMEESQEVAQQSQISEPDNGDGEADVMEEDEEPVPEVGANNDSELSEDAVEDAEEQAEASTTADQASPDHAMEDLDNGTQDYEDDYSEDDNADEAEDTNPPMDDIEQEEGNLNAGDIIEDPQAMDTYQDDGDHHTNGGASPSLTDILGYSIGNPDIVGSQAAENGHGDADANNDALEPVEGLMDPENFGQNAFAGAHNHVAMGDGPIDNDEADDLIQAYNQNWLEMNRQGRGNHGEDAQASNELVGDDVSDDGEERSKQFVKAKKAYNRKKSKGTNTFEDDIEFERLVKAEKGRKALLKRHQEVFNNEFNHDLEDADDNDLFVAPGPSQTHQEDTGYRNISDPQPIVDDSDDSATGFSGYHKEDGTNKKKGNSQQSKKANAKQNKRGAVKKSGSGKGKKESKKQQAENQRLNNLFNASSLTSSSVFRAAQTNNARSEQPTFSSRRKDEALKELLASIPEKSREAAKVDTKQLLVASKKFTGRGSCKSDGHGKWQVTGMRSALDHYQMLGVSFMRERETTPVVPAGGLLADDMGLGKTVMSIANIANDKWADRGNRKATLIVAPSSINMQWIEELKKHAITGEVKTNRKHAIGSILHYSPAMTTDNDVEYLASHGVVVTSYHQVMRSYPKKDPPTEITSKADQEAWWKKYFNEHKGLLHQVHWRRVILDEATAIKNHSSQTFLACNELAADFRWAVTGTPAMNSLEEFYSYFRFLRVPNVGSFKAFKKNFITNAPGSERLTCFIRPFMLRRTHNDEIFGAKLLNLPAPSRETMSVHFNSFEHEIYRIVHDRFVTKINGLSERGELDKQYRNILVLLLRLRQLTAHPLLIQDTMRDLLEPEDFHKIHVVLEHHMVQPQGDMAAIIVHIRKMLRDPKSLPQLQSVTEIVHGLSGESQQSQNEELRAATATDQANESSTAAAPPTVSTGGAFGLKDNFANFLRELKNKQQVHEIGRRLLCSKCRREPKDPHVVSCNHTYCWNCLFQMEVDAGNRGQQQATCLACGSHYTGKKRYNVHEIEQSISNAQATHDATRTSGSPVVDGDKQDKKKKSTMQETIDSWIDADGHMLPSAKTIAFKAQILNWLEENPKTKIIVYTQFMSLVKIMVKICQIEGWGYLQLHGSMSMKSRHSAIAKFGEDPSKNLMLATLRTGGVGLNMTMATRVIIMDPWWNLAVEEQAFCRTYRRGQEKSTAMTRLVVEGTVDSQISLMQERKDLQISSVMSEGARNQRMPTSKLLQLFGNTSKEQRDDGTEFVIVEEPGWARRARAERREAMGPGGLTTETEMEGDSTMAE